MLDGQSEPQWKSRINSLSQRLEGVHPSRPVHLELASMTNAALVVYMADLVSAGNRSLTLIVFCCPTIRISVLKSIKLGIHKLV